MSLAQCLAICGAVSLPKNRGEDNSVRLIYTSSGEVMFGDTFKNKVALVTGGGRGIGCAFAQALASAGASVVLAARSESEISEVAKAIRTRGGNALAVQADISKSEDVKNLVQAAISHNGHVDILINNAGITGPIQPVIDTDPEQWWHTIEVNVRGTFLVTRLVLPTMVARSTGRIINISSGAAYGVFPNLSSYATSKAALAHFTRCLAAELEPHHISVIAFNPGFVQTSMLENAATSADVDPLSRETFRHVLESGHARSVTDVIPKLMYLAAGHADTLSGRFLDIDDDFGHIAATHEDIAGSDLYTLQRKT
jgi:NAD(P)-dependent dehydrogenase (short-subunit alcohol dehydrogenase family)